MRGEAQFPPLLYRCRTARAFPLPSRRAVERDPTGESLRRLGESAQRFHLPCRRFEGGSRRFTTPWLAIRIASWLGTNGSKASGQFGVPECHTAPRDFTKPNYDLTHQRLIQVESRGGRNGRCWRMGVDDALDIRAQAIISKCMPISLEHISFSGETVAAGVPQ